MNERLSEAVNRRLEAEEVRAYLAQPITEAEREEVFALVRWFRRRYPSPAERLTYARRAYARWTLTRAHTQGR